MDRLDALRLFTRIVERGSFSRAAAELGIPRATATYSIKALEARLHARLLERTTRQVRPTLDGQAFYSRCVEILDALEEAEGALHHTGASPRGRLRVDLHGTHATHVVLPHLDAFHRRYPEIQLAISSGDRLVDLVREGIDCVIRAGTPRDSSLVARRLALMPEAICASPDYLARRGVPRVPDDLHDHEAVGFFSSNHDIDYPFELVVDGVLRTFELPCWVAVSDAESYVACALHGCGLIQLPRFHVEEALREGRLVEVLAGWRSPGVPLSAMYPQHRQLAPRVRVFIDWVAQLYEARFGGGDAGAETPDA
ncbi:LysR family transcriptional regulator [Coralloluteibacterium thermophilus]|uniref:LysR family transcriptional regulator n=1 Tax=Coralloluteibacterium thermophilum TaxID=2707049 RepID=A0ABV9NM54_9GAMM